MDLKALIIILNRMAATQEITPEAAAKVLSQYCEATGQSAGMYWRQINAEIHNWLPGKALC